jgi:hypothetical protein
MICKNSLMDTQICKCPECYSPPGGKALASVSGSTARRTLQTLIDTYKAYARDELRKRDEAAIRAAAYQIAVTDAERELDKLPKQVP